MTDSNDAYPYKRAWNYVLWLLGRRMYTQAELRDKLQKKGATDDDIAAILARLVELKLSDDSTFAESYVAGRKHRKGPHALRQELKRKGVAKQIVADTLDDIDPSDERRAVTRLLDKHAWRFQKAVQKDDVRKAKAKAYGFLARRGFSSEVVSEVLDDAKMFQAEDD
ncbi:MAG: regulatory protein RecX [Trueperaceae bacterium]|nr:regulatory protein RecX [Trueperaceae bacterium]